MLLTITRFLKLSLWIAVWLCLFVLGANIWMVSSTKDHIYHVAEDVPASKVALVLGTSKRTSSGGQNRFFAERMSTAAQLYHLGVVRHILVSGDNSTRFYNEPMDMLNALGELNIPDSCVSLDYAGFRTLDSIIRSKEVFGAKAITIVTQQFHCYRSLFIAHHFGIEAYAVSADNGGPIGSALAIREVLARAVAVLDLYVFRREPKFLGEREEMDI